MKYFVMDVDGTFTDGKTYMGESVNIHCIVIPLTCFHAKSEMAILLKS